MSLRLALLVLLVPVAGRACTPSDHGHLRPYHESGEACSEWWYHDSYGSTRLGLAEDLGSGFVTQTIDDGGACVVEGLSVMVMDCRTGEAVGFEVEASDPFGCAAENPDDCRTDSEAFSGRLLDDVRQGRASDIGTIAGSSQAASLPTALFTTTSHVRATPTSRRGFRLGCACRTFYPDLPGARR